MVTPEHEDVSDEDSAAVNPSSPSAGPPPSAEQRGCSRRENLHMHHHMPASSPNLPHLLLELNRSILWLPKARMKIQQPWNHKVTWVIVQGHRRERKVHRNRVHKIKMERKLLKKSSRVNCRRPKIRSPWIQTKTIKNLKNEPGTSSNSRPIVPVLSLPQGPQQVLKDQLPVTTLRMNTVSTATEKVHEVRTPKGHCSSQISTF